MKFLLQTPAHSSGTKVRYDDETYNLYTVNEMVAEPGFYQTFGDIVLSFDKLTGRVYSVSGRIGVNSYPHEDISNLTKAEKAYLVTSYLELKNIDDEVDYTFDDKTKILRVAATGKVGRQHALIMENVVVELTADAELSAVYIQLT